MISLAILAFIVLVLPVFGVGPLVLRGGYRASNNAFLVKLPEDEITLSQNNSPRGRHAQEIIDWYHRHVIALPLTVLLALVVDFTPLGWEGYLILALIEMSIAAVWPKLVGNHFDLVGHEAEIIVAERDGWEGYREAEVARMWKNTNYKGWSLDRIRAGLRRRHWLAVAFLGLLKWRVG